MRNQWMFGLVMALSAGLAAAAAPKQVVLDVQNVTCPACSITIGKALDKVPGVQREHVDTGRSTVTVVFDPSRTSVADISQAISAAGFPAKARANGG